MFFFLMIRRPPRSTQGVSSAASDVYKRQVSTQSTWEFRNLKFKMPLKLDSLPILYEDKMSSKSTAHSELTSTKRFERKLILPSASSKKQIKLYTHSHLEEEDPNNLTFGKSEQA
eukprot:TRINITY_DN8732_c0_g1_i1.p2 TRINITY_DN8732_c0_g1~~TRINITY_DN8732_c0_g1_i1.p2  ORF type:complete len:115 (-),score=27.32 TRINITY_DN8732_c0_g1_i1:197-541(-)